jgi:hypothetical protein
MSIKLLFVIALIILLGIFIYLKIQISGSPNSNFNQTTRFRLAKHPALRTILGMHGVGDARAEYLEGTGPITIEWFSPQEENIDTGILTKFANLVTQYTGRPTTATFAGAISDGTVNVSDFASYRLKAGAQVPAGSVMLVFLPQDYSPRPNDEISTAYQESGMILSINAHHNFLQSYPQYMSQYMLSSMLYEFGKQIGLPETATTISSNCIMNLHAGINGHPVEYFGTSDPQDFCPAEIDEIKNIKLQLQQ